MNSAKIYFIGGVSGAGKTYTTDLLSQIPDPKLKVIRLDSFYNGINQTIKDAYGTINATNRADKLAKEYARKISLAVTRDALVAKVSCIIEGVWLNLDQAIDLKRDYPQTFLPVFCGYPGADARERYDDFQRRNSPHWLLNSSLREAALKTLDEQIKASQQMKLKCEENDIPFFDFTVISEGNADLHADFLNRMMPMHSEHFTLPLLAQSGLPTKTF